ncbi:MAG: nitroreductase family protein, partial [Sedimentisphaerales bacterium]|nr:nitroreductase family protein [Sedimentisphaerales bacterium]
TSDTWVEDCSIAAILIQLTAQSLGLGSCWVQVRLRGHDQTTSAAQFVQGLLGIPEPLTVECIVALGYPAEKKRPISSNQLEWSKIHTNRFSATSS